MNKIYAMVSIVVLVAIGVVAIQEAGNVYQRGASASDNQTFIAVFGNNSLNHNNIQTLTANVWDTTWLEFDGVNDNLTIKDNNQYSINKTGTIESITISFWMNSDSFVTNDTYSVILGKGLPNAEEYEFIVYNESDANQLNTTIAFNIFNISGESTNASFQDNLNTSQWMHIVGVINQTNIQIWRDGVNRSFVSYDGIIYPVNTNSPLVLGTKNMSYNYYGYIDDVRIWNTSLNSTQIASLYNNGRTGSLSLLTDNLVGYWKLDENSGAVAYDLSNTSNNGTITGASWKNSGTTTTLTANTDYLLTGSSGLFDLLNLDYISSEIDVDYTHQNIDFVGRILLTIIQIFIAVGILWMIYLLLMKGVLEEI